MVLLVQRLGKLYTKLENHYHHHNHYHSPDEEALLASLQAFQFGVSSCINQLASNTKPRSEFLSFSWVQQSLEHLQMINKAFAKLAVEIDYPMSKWEAKPIEEYLNCSLTLLELLNSISSALSHLRQARLSLSHVLCLVENSPSLAVQNLKAIQPKSSKMEYKEKETKGSDDEERPSSGKERVVLEALMEVKSLGLWSCGVVLAALSGDANSYLEMRKVSVKSENSPLSSLDSSVYEAIAERGCVLKEVKEVNDAVESLVRVVSAGKSSDATAEELQRRLEVYEKLLDGLGVEVDRLFAVTLAGRNELLDTIRQKQ